MGTMQNMLNLLAQLYRLKAEGKNVDAAIEELEDKIFEHIDCDKNEPDD